MINFLISAIKSSISYIYRDQKYYFSSLSERIGYYIPVQKNDTWNYVKKNKRQEISIERFSEYNPKEFDRFKSVTHNFSCAAINLFNASEYFLPTTPEGN